jgi:hypothetical protein
LKPKKERGESAGVETDATFKGEGETFEFRFKFTTNKVPMQCPIVLLIKVG